MTKEVTLGNSVREAEAWGVLMGRRSVVLVKHCWPTENSASCVSGSVSEAREAGVQNTASEVLEKALSSPRKEASAGKSACDTV